ncbi:MAG: hypothetical protein A3I78_05455 [Gammaproteobacteria bacterium RIFCSPLOWO2_02_FULL_56_15]|nr:MAG: hypothetical protein A3I78_05455 [Gammaproteobacteria bacterium RIFCSPLOWO2_02_FULL_56_15]
MVERVLSGWKNTMTNKKLFEVALPLDAINKASAREKSLRDGGVNATSYADAVGVYLACGISRSADFWSSLCIWANQPKNELVTHQPV